MVEVSADSPGRAPIPLRRAWLRNKRIQMADKRKVVVIGAGTSGPAAAHTLLKRRRETLPDSVKDLFFAGGHTHLPVTSGLMRSGVDAARDSVSFLSRRHA